MNYRDLIGVNTHIDFTYAGSPYVDLPKVIKSILYLGVEHLRDAAGKPDTYKKWIEVRNATAGGGHPGVRFCTFLPNGSPDYVRTAFTYLPMVYRNGLVDMFEAPNEPDKPYSIQAGNGIDWAVEFTREVVEPFVDSITANGKRIKPLINISVGAGWSQDDNWKGNYDALPNMVGCCDLANAHTYPGVGQDPIVMVKKLNALAQLSMPGKPVIITELGWDLRAHGQTQDQIAADIVKICNAGLTNRLYIYALFDDQSGRFGLFDNDGTPRPGAKAIRKLILGG